MRHKPEVVGTLSPDQQSHEKGVGGGGEYQVSTCGVVAAVTVASTHKEFRLFSKAQCLHASASLPL